MDWRHIPSLAALRAFEAAARHGSFTKAAAELNVTQAAVAQHVRALEAEFSRSFVTRQGRGIALTEAGRRLAEPLRSGFEVIEEGVRALREETAARPLQISTTPTFAANWLMPRIGDFWAEHPKVQVNIFPTEDLVDMRADGIDLAIRFGSGGWPGLEAELLTDGDFWVVAAPSLLKGTQVTELADVANLPWVLESRPQERHYLLEAAGLELAELKVSQLNTTALVLSAVRAGLGVSLQHSSIVEGDVARGDLRRVCALGLPGTGYYMAALAGRQRPGLQVCRRWLKSQAGRKLTT